MEKSGTILRGLLFMTLTLLWRTGQLSCKNIRWFGFVQCFNIIRLLCCTLGKIHITLTFSESLVKGCIVSVCLLTHDAFFDHLVKTMTTRMVILFLFVTNNHLLGRYFETTIHPASHYTSAQSVRPPYLSRLVFHNLGYDCFSTSVSSFTFINWNSTSPFHLILTYSSMFACEL